MRHDFSEVTAEQRAALFPIRLEPYNPLWPALYQEEAGRLTALFGAGNTARISHIGSTSVPGLTAKPTIDILLEIPHGFNWEAISETLLDLGYVTNTPPADLVLLLKGYTPQGFEGQAYHIHLRYSGDWDELYFRDYLRTHPQAAGAYVQLKTGLQTQYTNDRDAYTDAKAAFVKQHSALGRALFAGRYLPAD